MGVVLPAGKPEAQQHISEVRNSILALQTNFGRRPYGTSLPFDKDLPMEKFGVWNQVQKAGAYREMVTQARGMQYTIYSVGFYSRMPFIRTLLLIAVIIVPPRSTRLDAKIL